MNGWTWAGSSDRNAERSRKLYSAPEGVLWMDDALVLEGAVGMMMGRDRMEA